MSALISFVIGWLRNFVQLKETGLAALAKDFAGIGWLRDYRDLRHDREHVVSRESNELV